MFLKPTKTRNPTYSLKHLQTSNGNAFGSPVDPTVLIALVAPLGAGTGVQQYTDKEEIDQALALFRVVDIFGECGQEVSDAVAAADGEVLVTAVAGDGCERSVIVSLYR